MQDQEFWLNLTASFVDSLERKGRITESESHSQHVCVELQKQNITPAMYVVPESATVT